MSKRTYRALSTFCAAIIMAAGLCQLTAPLQAQSILEQLEKKVRDGLELTPPVDPAARPAPADASELPAPASSGSATTGKKSPPPLPQADGSSNSKRSAPRPSSSILEAPALPSATNPTPDAVPDAGIYLGLEAESLTGGGIGARIVTVTNNSPAWRAGFKSNDVILAIDGFAISNLDTMVDRLSLRGPGDTIKVLLLRGNRNVELTAVLQNAALAQRIQGVNPNNPIPSPLTPPGNAWLGVVVADLSSAFRTQFGLRAFRAAAVTNVTRGSPADVLSIQPGDAIVGVDGQPIESARQLLDWMATKRPGDFVSLNVMRGTRSSILETTLAADPKSLPGNPTSAANRLPMPDPFAPGALASGSLASGTLALENTVPSPALPESAEVEQLRGELKAAQNQIQSLEQRLAELETLIKRK